MIRNVVTVVSLLVLFVALWPTAHSLYDLTGEETLAAQIRGVIHWLNTAVRPQPHLAPTDVIHYESIGTAGMNTFLQNEVEIAKRERSLQLIRAAGFVYIRQEFPWEDIEIHGKGDFEDRRNVEAIGVVDAWAKYDNIVALAEQYDIEILARLSNPPAWSRALPDEIIGSQAPPDMYTDYGDFAAAVATRYHGRITAYQLWNEPNIYPEWGEQNVNPEAYTVLLCTAYERIKAIDPDAVIVAGAMSPTIAMDGRNMNDLIFLQRMYKAGAGDCFDILSSQGYGLWSGPTDQRLRPTVINYPHHLFLRDVMVRNGDAHKPIWVSEMGWNSVPDGIPANFGQVTEAEQARYAVEAYQRAQADWPWLAVINYWFFKRPGDSERDQSWYYFRLMEPDFTPLPAYEALVDYSQASVPVMPTPDWVFGWQRLRPFLFGMSSAILFFITLLSLAPSHLVQATKEEA